MRFASSCHGFPAARAGRSIAPPRHGWITVYDDVCDRDPAMLRRLAKELSDRMGSIVLLLGVERDELVRMILFECGRIVDEYLSVPEFYGPLPPGDVVALAANPRVVSRLTGADPEAVRRIAVTAPSPAELPPARELLVELAQAMRIEGAEHGWEDASGLDGAIAHRPAVNVLLLHAWPLDESMWAPQLEPIRAAGLEPVAPRLYGRGRVDRRVGGAAPRRARGAVRRGGRLDGRLLRAGARPPSL